MARSWKIALGVLGVFVVLGLISFPALLRSVLGLKRASVSDEQARRAIVQPSISTPTDTPASAQLFWASTVSLGTLDPVTIQLALSADPVQRAKQLITALIERAPSAEQRTLPADAALQQFYLLPDGTAVADFSDVLATETPSGILSEQMVVDSIVRTLAANLSGVTRLKILIRGEETETLAGHLDLTGFFPVTAPTPPDPAASAPGPISAAPTPTAVSSTPAPNAASPAPSAHPPHPNAPAAEPQIASPTTH